MDRELLWLALRSAKGKRGELCSKLRIASSQFRLSEIGDLLVGRFHGSNHMPTKIGSLRCSCGMPG